MLLKLSKFEFNLMFSLQRTEKGQEYNLFVLKIQKLEKLCRALQEERKGLYQKIKEVCQSNANLPKVFFNLVSDEPPVPEDHQEQQEEEDPVLTENIARLRDEQAKLQEIAASLLGSPDSEEEEDPEPDLDMEEDEVVSAFVQFKPKTQTSEDPEDLEPPMSKDEARIPKPEGPSLEAIKMETDPEISEVQPQVQVREQKPDKAEEEIQKPPEPTPEPETPKTGPEPEASKVQTLEEISELQPTLPLEDKMVQQTVGLNPEPQTPDPESPNSETLEETGGVRSTPPVESEAQKPEEPSTASEKADDSSVKQAPKKKKKRSSRSWTSGKDEFQEVVEEVLECSEVTWIYKV